MVELPLAAALLDGLLDGVDLVVGVNLTETVDVVGLEGLLVGVDLVVALRLDSVEVVGVVVDFVLEVCFVVVEVA